MPLNETLRSQLKAATDSLRQRGPAAATSVIRKALGGLPTGVPRQFLDPGASMPAFGLKGDAPDFVSELLSQLGVGSPLDAQIGRMNSKAPIDPDLYSRDQSTPDSNAPGQFLTRSFTNHAGTRSYKLYIPSGYSGQAMPLMVMLHGCTQHPDDFAQGTRMNIVAEERQCFVIYPAQTQSANSSKCWNWFRASDQQRDQGEPSIIAGITREVIDAYKLDAKQVYIAGLSAGGAMAVIMGTAYPELYAAVGVHSGLPYAAAHDLPSAFAAMKGGASDGRARASTGANSRLASIPIIVFHGDRDTTVDPRNGEQLIEKNTSDSNKRSTVIVEEGKIRGGRAYTRTSHHHGDGPAHAEHWVIHGAGHAWAGGSDNGSYTDVAGPDATREMMRFFYTGFNSIKE